MSIDIHAPRIAVPKNDILLQTERDHSAGQTIRAKPNTAPFIQKIFALSSGLERSASTAWATDAFPHVIPSNIRDKKTTKTGKSISPNISKLGSRYASHKTIQLNNFCKMSVIKWVHGL